MLICDRTVRIVLAAVDFHGTVIYPCVLYSVGEVLRAAADSRTVLVSDGYAGGQIVFFVVQTAYSRILIQAVIFKFGFRESVVYRRLNDFDNAAQSRIFIEYVVAAVLFRLYGVIYGVHAHFRRGFFQNGVAGDVRYVGDDFAYFEIRRKAVEHCGVKGVVFIPGTFAESVLFIVEIFSRLRRNPVV